MNTIVANRDALITLLGMVVFQVTNFLLGIFIVRWLGVSEIGHYQYFIATATLLSYLAKMGGDERLSYLLPSIGGIHSEEGRFLVFSILTRSALASLLWSLIFVTIHYIFTSQFGTGMDYKEAISFLVYLPVFVAVGILSSVLRAEHKNLARSFFVYFTPNLINFIFILLISGYIFQEFSSLMSRVLAYGVILVSLVIYVNKKFDWSITSKTSARFSVVDVQWLIFSIINYIIESGFIAVWLGKYVLPQDEYGIFTILLRLSSLIMLVPSALLIVYGPLLSKMPDDRKLITSIFVYNFIGVTIAFGVLFFLSELLLSFFGMEYVKHSNDLIAMGFFVFLFSLTQPVYSLTLALKKNRLLYMPGIILSLVSCILFFVLDINSLESLILYVCTIFISFSLIRLLLLFYYQRTEL